jgi:hypothetical protein
MKSIAADPNGTDPGEEPESRSKKQQRKTTKINCLCCVFG